MRTTVLVVVALLAIAPLQLHGQGLTPAQVEELRKAHDEVFVHVAGSDRLIHGLLTSHTGETLTLTVDGRPYPIPMASVRRIDTMTRRFIKKGAGIGAIVGAGLGAWCAFICGQGMDSDESVWPAVLTQFGISTAIGAVSAAGARGLNTVYSAPTATQPYTGPLPCPATPLVVTAPLIVPDRRTWGSAGFGDYHSMGERRCDGVAIRSSNKDAAGTWQSGVLLRFKDAGDEGVWITARVTAQLPRGERDRTADLVVMILDGASVVASEPLLIDAESGEVTKSVKLLLPRAVFASATNLSLSLKVATRYD